MRELILTGYEKFWPKNEDAEKDALYLGPWCFASNKKRKFSEQENYNLATPPWAKWKELESELNYLENLTIRLIPVLAKFANQQNKVSESNLFWQKILLPWVSIWLQNYYDRYKRIENVLKSETEITVKIAKNRNRPTENYLDFIHGYRSHIYNLYLMSSILKNSKLNRQITLEELEIENQPPTNQKKSIQEILSNIIVQLNPLPLEIGTVYGFSIFDKLYFHFRYFFSVLKRNQWIESADERKRAKEINLSQEFIPEQDFEETVLREIWNFIPTELLKYQKPIFLKSLIIGNNYYDSKFQYQVAHSSKRGGKWFSFQHGGGYGEFELWPQGFIEYSNSDGFITWGWKAHLYKSIFFPLSSPMLSKLKPAFQNNQRLVYVTTMHPAYCMRFQSALLPEQQLNFIRNSVLFFQSIEEEILENSFYRSYPDQGQGALESIETLIPRDRILSSGKLIPHLENSKLVVIDHLATSFHESFVIGKPTIMYWDPEHFGENDHAKKYFDKLRNAGILFNDARSAAEKVNEIWKDVDSWWQSKEVKNAVNEFCIEFAKTNREWRGEWANFISCVS